MMGRSETEGPLSGDLDVTRHYGRVGILENIRAALSAAGRDPDRIAPGDLAAVDEFHLGWHPATLGFAEAMAIGPGMRVLDIGAGLGGPARHFARLGATVEGIDLTPEYVAAGQALTEASGLAHRVRLQVGDALALPFESGAFDAATLLHVGMNIADKAALFAEVARVVRTGGRFGLYDVMRVAEGDLPYPLPFAAGPETSFVERPETYRRLLAAAGFRMVSERDRSAFVLDLAAEARARITAEGPPVLGMHLVVGPEARGMVGALVGCLERGMLAPVEMIAERA
jgi:SAM-dependent methyltransferase